MARHLMQFALLCSLAGTVLTTPLSSRNNSCRKTKVAVLGAGVAGITAAIQGLGTPGGPENPIWTLVKKYKVKSQEIDMESLETFDESGPVDYTSKVDDFDEAYSVVEQTAGLELVGNLQDRSMRAALRIAGWNPVGDPRAQAVEWMELDFEYAQTPDTSSEIFTIVNYNTTYYQFSAANNFAIDSRGFNAFIYGQASEFLKPKDPRLLLHAIVTNITYSDDGVVITTKDGQCVSAEYAINTFSVGVLQSSDVTFTPPLPDWKREAIQTFEMGIYTKIFFQFPPDKVFWNKSTQFFLYASKTRGFYPLWQNLDNEDFLPGSGIFFVTVVTEQSYAVESQDDELTKNQILATLRQMFGVDAVPEPIAFMYPRWGKIPWAYGSYSNWPPGFTLEAHQNLRANVGPVWFAGEANSAEYYGFLHGAYYEGKYAGEKVAACVNGSTARSCVPEKHYEVLNGTTEYSEYSPTNGWFTTSFQTIGIEES